MLNRYSLWLLALGLMPGLAWICFWCTSVHAELPCRMRNRDLFTTKLPLFCLAFYPRSLLVVTRYTTTWCATLGAPTMFCNYPLHYRSQKTNRCKPRELCTSYSRRKIKCFMTWSESRWELRLHIFFQGYTLWLQCYKAFEPGNSCLQKYLCSSLNL